MYIISNAISANLHIHAPPKNTKSINKQANSRPVNRMSQDPEKLGAAFLADELTFFVWQPKAVHPPSPDPAPPTFQSPAHFYPAFPTADRQHSRIEVDGKELHV